MADKSQAFLSVYGAAVTHRAYKNHRIRPTCAERSKRYSGALYKAQ